MRLPFSLENKKNVAENGDNFTFTILSFLKPAQSAGAEEYAKWITAHEEDSHNQWVYMLTGSGDRY